MNDTDRPEKSNEMFLTPEEIKLITAYRSNPRVHQFLDVFLRPETDETEEEASKITHKRN